jgi:hypothetical protein
MENISEHITFDEATNSQTAKEKGIKNIPDSTQLTFMKSVAVNCFEPVRNWYKKPLNINSFFRCRALNIAIKGALNSQHEKGQAIDISAGSKEENKKIFDYIKANLKFDQLINEFDYKWIHVSFVQGANRNMTLKATKNATGQTVYSNI